MTAPDSSLFDYSHLPEHLQAVSKEFYNLADYIERRMPTGVERDMALRKLLESKDCAVRAVVLGNRYAVEGEIYEPAPTMAERILNVFRTFEGERITGGQFEEYLEVPFDQIEPHLALLIHKGEVLQVTVESQADPRDLRVSELVLRSAYD